jgi:hypothetical protein
MALRSNNVTTRSDSLLTRAYLQYTLLKRYKVSEAVKKEDIFNHLLQSDAYFGKNCLFKKKNPQHRHKLPVKSSHYDFMQ